MSGTGSLPELQGSEGDSAYYLELFLDEGREGLERLQLWLGSLSGRVEDRELIAEAFRVLHGFKGMADTLAFHDLAAVAHALEGLLDAYRWGRGAITAEALGEIQIQVRWLQSRLSAVADGAAPLPLAQVAPAVAALTALSADFAPPGQGRWEQALSSGLVPEAPPPAEGAQRWSVRLKLDEHCFMKAARALLATTALEALGPVLDVSPSLEELEWAGGGDGFSVVVLTAASEGEIQDVVGQLSELCLEALVPLGALGEEAPALPSPPLPQPASLPPPAPEAPDLPPLPSAPPTQHHKARPRRSVRVDAEALGGLVRRAQGLADALSLMGGLGEQAQEAKALAKALASLTELPLGQALLGLERQAHELARDLGKRLRFELVGGDCKVPRALADELVDLLGHLLRNAVDHGLESPAKRESLGKRPDGLVRVLIEREASGALVVQLSDDGRGIDPQPLWARAIAKGFLGADDAEAMQELDPLSVLTLPGFTSRDEATRHSGRGVGLDVVKRRTEDWGGALIISTEPGRGTSFRLRWPNA